MIILFENVKIFNKIINKYFSNKVVSQSQFRKKILYIFTYKYTIQESFKEI